MVGLIADIGGTNARFALADPASGIGEATVLPCAEQPSLVAACEAYLGGLAPDQRPSRAAICVACPVIGDQVTLTNLPWSFSIEATRQELGLDVLSVVNDFTAVALAVPHLGPDELMQVGGGAPVPGAARTVLGPGTGLGASGLLPAGDGWVALNAEGGHVTMAATTDREAAVLDRLRARHGHASAERVLSGPGLVNLYHALRAIDDLPVDASITPADVAERGIGDQCATCAEAMAMAAEMLGTFASNHALTLGARGGVYIAGGIVPRYPESFARSGFRRRFEDKGRFSDYLAAVPTYVVTCDVPAFIGLAGLIAKP